MHHIVANNPDEALDGGLWWLKVAGKREESRNGPVLVSPSPVFTTNVYPQHRVMFSPVRDANPFFHLFEALWMLAGQRHVEPLLLFNSKMGEYVDPGEDDLHGAYGYRWRKAFMKDQVAAIIRMLKKDPTTRQAVLQVWHTDYDLQVDSRDIPCNTQAYFRVKRGALDMCVTARSNDAIWGCHGANVVQWSMLLEYIACATGLRIGELQQFSFNYHIYPELPVAQRMANKFYTHVKHYENGTAWVSPNLCTPDTANAFMEDCEHLMNVVHSWDAGVYHDEHWGTLFMEEVAAPLFVAWFRRKQGLSYELESAWDWHVAGREWFERRDNDGSK